MDLEPLEVEPLQYNNEVSHVVILHEKLSKRKIDRYIINLALAYHKLGYKVTILTSQFDKKDCITDIRFSDKIQIQYSGWWIPGGNLKFSFFENIVSGLKAIVMACRLIFCPPDPRPEIVILDTSLLALFLMKCFTNYKVYYVENFSDLKNKDACFEHSKVKPSLLTAKWIKLSDEIIVETIGFAEILMKSHPSLTKHPKVLYPSIDLGIWNEPSIHIQRIAPDINESTLLFLTIGKFRRSSNFKLALDAFELFLDLIEDKVVTRRFQLIIAGNCKSPEEKFHYSELLTMAKQRVYASQITFLRQLPRVHEKTLINEAIMIIHPTVNDVSSEFLLKAMCLGKPIIATNKGIASKLLVHRLSGVILDPEPKVFAAAMKKVLISPHLQIFLGDMARDTFEKSLSFNCFCERIYRMTKKPNSSSSSNSMCYVNN